MDRPSYTHSGAELLAGESRSGLIANTLRDEILVGQYRPGERLPSERDLSERFHASRGAVREAFKKLEQLGLTAINPGGARVVPLENASLDIIGPLLALTTPPDANLVDEVFEALGGLYQVAVIRIVRFATADEITEICSVIKVLLDPGLSPADRLINRSKLGRLLMQYSHSLVLKLISNSLQTQFEQPIRPVSGQPQPQHHQGQSNIATDELIALDQALLQRHEPAAAFAIAQLSQVHRRQISELIASARRIPAPGASE